jgi:anti-anti-sigma regulatory factor
MFRVTTEDTADALLLKLEGCLSGAWVEALDACWSEATKTLNGRPIRVDLREVFWVDDAGRQLLTRMHQAGVGFMARGCFFSELVREISRGF